MKMVNGGLKTIGGLMVAWFTYIDKTFSPLFWVLLALVALDLFLNAHKEGKQFEKIGSMAVSLGVPGYVAANLSNPELGKYLVAILCLVHIQIVIPALLAKLQDFKFSSDPKQNAIDEAAVAALVEKQVQAITQKAQAEISAAQAPSTPSVPTIIKDAPPVAPQTAPKETEGV